MGPSMPLGRGSAPLIRADDPCPCGSPKAYGECCGREHHGAEPLTAERLMRSRYSAFATGDAEYLLLTWHSSTRPATLRLDPAVEWLGLDVLGVFGGSAFEREGIVEFVARYRVRRAGGEQHERSRFRREDGRWRYLGEAPLGEPPHDGSGTSA